VKGYADYVTLISRNLDDHVTVLQLIDQRAGNLDISYLFGGSKWPQKGIPLSKGSYKINY